MKRKYIVLIGLIIIILCIWLSRTIYHWGKTLSETTGVSDSASPEYLHLFSDSIRPGLAVFITRTNTGRHPFTDLIYAKKFSIVVYKIDLAVDQPLDELIKEERGSVDIDPNLTYNVNSIPGFDLQTKSGAVIPANVIYLKISGDSAKALIKNDSIASFYLKNNEFSIRYGKDSLTDICSVAHSAFEKERPKTLLFIKRYKALYFLLLSSLSIEQPLPEDLLYQLTENKSR